MIHQVHDVIYERNTTSFQILCSLIQGVNLIPCMTRTDDLKLLAEVKDSNLFRVDLIQGIIDLTAM